MKDMDIIQFERKFPKAKQIKTEHVQLGGEARDISASIQIWQTDSEPMICCTWKDPGNDGRFLTEKEFQDKYPYARESRKR